MVQVLFLPLLVQSVSAEASGCTIGDVPPVWPPRVSPVWPMKFVATMTNHANTTLLGKHYYEALHTTWHYDNVNLLREDFHPDDPKDKYPYKNSAALFNGTSGNYDLHFYPANKTDKVHSCVRIPMGISIMRPDCFADKTYIGRQCVGGKWADGYQFDMGGQYGIFEFWSDIRTNFPLADSGVSRVVPSVIKAMTNMTSVTPVYRDQMSATDAWTPARYGNGTWAALFEMRDHPGKCLPVPLTGQFKVERSNIKKLHPSLRHHAVRNLARAVLDDFLGL